ncbi:unnamed protein product [Allacma fusca]|uniref:Aminopeptidase N n=1 Tax=Allacma fusca TaxID=39272 RepID=A0A8J2J789_9HEXA|nr:unnamed protein product [Allacma fusca]
MLKTISVVSVVLGLIASAVAGPPLRLQEEPTALFKNGLHLVPSEVPSDILADEFRLPLDVKPLSYEIHTIPIVGDQSSDPNFAPFTAPGRVKIQVQCDVATNKITLHAAEITIALADITVTDDEANSPIVITSASEGEHQFYIIQLAATLVQGKNYTIDISKFIASVRDVSRIDPKVGLYRAEYTDPSTKQQSWLATTQFETIGFRYFCPGFDEPSFKAEFTVHIARHKDFNSASNTVAVATGQPGDGTKPAIPTDFVWDTFTKTVKTSSYLLALVVSDFKHTLAQPGLYRLPAGILGPPYLMDLGGGQYAADESAKILKTFEEIFPSLEYPMGKMDSVAIPRNYFTFGAMENWGLNTYKDNLLLYYNGVSTEANRYQIASILSHELAHQWFGNRVTTTWWSHIWLNEGFATYMSFAGMRHLEHYDTERQIVADAVQTALAADGGSGSTPVVHAGTKEEVEQMTVFGTMAYQKGASLIYMMEGFMGKENLMKGLTQYLTAMTFKAAHQDDLFRELQTFFPSLPEGRTLKDIMETWTLKRGFPLVRVQRGSANSIYVSQERFTSSGNSGQEVDPDVLWDVPISVATATDANSFTDVQPKFWLKSDAALMSYRADNLNTSKWIVVNPNVHGYYRVLYDTQMARLIQNQLETDHTVISALNRGQFLNDYFTFVDLGIVPYESALAFTKYLAKEKDHAVWRPALAPLAKLLPHFTGTQPGLFGPFQAYFSPKFGGALDLLEWDQKPDEHGVNVLLRASLLDWACTLEHAKCKELANSYFDKWMANPAVNPIPVDLQNVLYCAGAFYGGDNAYEHLFKKYIESLSNNQDINSETTRLVSALTCSQSMTSLIKLVREAIDGPLIPKNHVRLILEGVGTNAKGRDLVYGVLRDEWKHISDYLGGNPGDPKNALIISSIVNTLAIYQNSADEPAKISAIVEKILVEDFFSYLEIAVPIGRAVTKIRDNVSAGPPLAPLKLLRKQRSVGTENFENVSKSRHLTAETEFRIPQNVVPSKYDIHIIPIIDEGVENFQRWSAYGSAKIHIICNNETRRITLHAAGIDIQDEDVKVFEGQQELTVTGTDMDEPNDFFHIDLQNNLEQNKEYLIEITKYVAEVRDLTKVGLKLGLYRAEYTDFEGNQKWLATTQFASVGFRRFCPGFDEPDFKATFTLHIGRSTAYNSASNSELDLEAITDPSAPALPSGWEWDNYKPTVVMSSYLLALVVSDFVREESSSDLYPKPVSVLGPPHLVNDHHGGVFAAEISAKLLKSFDTVFGTDLEYSMHKMDSVAIPRDYFSFGAMENWGLIIYRDDRLMYYEGITTEEARYRIANIVSHELAHQWFGNLVTNKWWSHVWLNEGFATYLSFLGVSNTLSEYESDKRIVYEATQVALSFDAGPTSHPIINTATQQQVTYMSIFDDISYEKGSALIRMMEGFMGKDALINGLQLYLKNMSSKGAVQDDLFLQLQDVATDLPEGKTIKTIMDTWTLQKGFPLIRVQRGNANTIYISQERYTNNANSNTDSVSDELWEVPIAIATASDTGSFTNPKPKLWLNKDEALVPYRTDALDTTKLLILNPNVHGYYRVLYDTHFARLIHNQLETDHTVISDLNRGQLFDDYFRFAEESYVSYESAFAFTKYLAKESSHAAWAPLLNKLAKMYPHFMGSTPGLFEPFQRYFSPKFGGALELLGWEQGVNEHGEDVILRATLLDWACTLKHEKCKEISNNFFTAWMEKPEENPIRVDLQNSLYCAGVAFGNEEVFDFVVKKYDSSLSNNHEINTETSRLVSALTCSQNTTTLSTLVWGTINGTLIQKAYLGLVLKAVGTNSLGRDLVYQVLRDQWKTISESTEAGPADPQIIADVVSELILFQNTGADVEKITAIAEKMVLDDLDAYGKIASQLGMSTQKIRQNALWVRDSGLPITQWFVQNTP